MTLPAVLLAHPAALGEELSEALRAQARIGASELAPGGVSVCLPGVDLLTQVEPIAARGDRPVLVVWPAVARLGRGAVQAALDDLDAGCDVVFGPLVDGGLYILGFRRLLDVVRTLLVEHDAVAGALSAAGESGLEIGYLRPERSLASPDGVALALADPLTPAHIRALLTG